MEPNLESNEKIENEEYLQDNDSNNYKELEDEDNNIEYYENNPQVANEDLNEDDDVNQNENDIQELDVDLNDNNNNGYNLDDMNNDEELFNDINPEIENNFNNEETEQDDNNNNINMNYMNDNKNINNGYINGEQLNPEDENYIQDEENLNDMEFNENLNYGDMNMEGDEDKMILLENIFNACKKVDKHNARYDVVMYVFEHINPDTYIMHASYDKIASATNVSYSTVVRTMQKMVDTGLLKKVKPGTWEWAMKDCLVPVESPEEDMKNGGEPGIYFQTRCFED